MSESNIDRFKKALQKLLDRGNNLSVAMQLEVDPETVRGQIKELYKEKAEVIIAGLPNFKKEYESWYSEAGNVIKQLLPDRYADFTSHYNATKSRKAIEYGNYVIEDYMKNLRVSRYSETIVDKSAAVPRFESQINILRACQKRFSSSLFDIRQLVQADLFDSELAAAKALLRQGFARAAGAMAGVVLEHHLQQVANNHNLKITKKNPTLGDLSQALKDGDVIDIAEWRRLQHLGDLRNLCDHKKDKDPTSDQVDDLIVGVERATKTLF